MTCDCYRTMDADLKAQNARLDIAILLTNTMDLTSRPVVAVTRIDATKRKALPKVLGNYCSFCGMRWIDEPTPEPVVPLPSLALPFPEGAA